jgi:hypothetical protein
MQRAKLLGWLALAALLVLVGGVAADAYFLDGLLGESRALVFGDTTKYADGYSERAFRNVRAGMSESEVRSAIGEPLSVFKTADGGIGWRYSGSKNDGSYRQRLVYFRGDKVVSAIHEFYVD